MTEEAALILQLISSIFVSKLKVVKFIFRAASGPGVRDQLTDAESLSRRESFLDIADRIYDKKILPNSLDQAAADPYLVSYTLNITL